MFLSLGAGASERAAWDKAAGWVDHAQVGFDLTGLGAGFEESGGDELFGLVQIGVQALYFCLRGGKDRSGNAVSPAIGVALEIYVSDLVDFLRESGFAGSLADDCQSPSGQSRNKRAANFFDVLEIWAG
jgi:hypothetical protein